MQRSNSDWYLVVIVAFLVAACFTAVFYLTAFTDASSEWFQNIGFAGFGALTTLLIPKSPDPPPAPNQEK